jgi:hypothetical protein
MGESVVRKAPLPWWAGGLILGLVQTIAIAVARPLGVSDQFLAAQVHVLGRAMPGLVRGHELPAQFRPASLGYGWWFDVGIVVGAALAALAIGRWKLRSTTAWWQANHGTAPGWARFATCFAGGAMILLGALLAHGCTSGQFASAWAQLSLSAIPFTIPLFLLGMLAARVAYPHAPEIEN